MTRDVLGLALAAAPSRRSQKPASACSGCEENSHRRCKNLSFLPGSLRGSLPLTLVKERPCSNPPDRQPRRDRRPHHPHRPAAGAAHASPSIPRPTPQRCTCCEADEAHPIGPASGARNPTCAAIILDVARRRPAPRPSTPATAFCPKTPISPRPAPMRGVAFIGPPPAAIRAMGSKAESKRLMVAAAGVPVVPGYHGDGTRTLEAAGGRRARGSATPLLIKAAAGGGGKGMRIVRAVRRISPPAIQPAPSARPGGVSAMITHAAGEAISKGPVTSRCRSSATATATSSPPR